MKKSDKIRLKKKMKRAFNDKIDDFQEMDNIREVLASGGLIDQEERKKERRDKLEKTLGSYSKL